MRTVDFCPPSLTFALHIMRGSLHGQDEQEEQLQLNLLCSYGFMLFLDKLEKLRTYP